MSFKRVVRRLVPGPLWRAGASRWHRLRALAAPREYGPLDTLPLDLYARRYSDLDRVRGYSDEAEARVEIARVIDNTMISYERAVTLYHQVKHLETRCIAGAFVECGVWKGGAVGIMALANLRYGRVRRDLHIFDSFQGLPEPSAADGKAVVARAESKAGRPLEGLGALRPVNWDEATRRDCEALFERIGYPSRHVLYHVGWFQETLADAAGLGEVALLRIDADWYESTKVCLEALYPLVVPGGFVIVDDYGHFEGCRRAVDEFLENRGITEYLHHIDYTGRYMIKSRG